MLEKRLIKKLEEELIANRADVKPFRIWYKSAFGWTELYEYTKTPSLLVTN